MAVRKGSRTDRMITAAVVVVVVTGLVIAGFALWPSPEPASPSPVTAGRPAGEPYAVGPLTGRPPPPHDPDSDRVDAWHRDWAYQNCADGPHVAGYVARYGGCPEDRAVQERERAHRVAIAEAEAAAAEARAAEEARREEERRRVKAETAAIAEQRAEIERQQAAISEQQIDVSDKQAACDPDDDACWERWEAEYQRLEEQWYELAERWYAVGEEGQSVDARAELERWATENCDDGAAATDYVEVEGVCPEDV